MEAGCRLTRSGAAYVIGLGSILDFLWLVLHCKLALKVGKLAVFVQVLILLGRWLQRLRFGFLDGLLQTLWVYCPIYCLTLLLSVYILIPSNVRVLA